MAEGRMLKKKIATSQRLAELKTNDARLLWTWLLPFLDIEGRYHASPDIIKGTVFPRISFFTTRKIKKCLEDLVRVKLISIYTVNGDQFLEFSNFKDNQTLRLDREKPSSIPAKPQLQEQLQDNSRSTPAEDKIREVNRRKDKLSKGTTVPFVDGTEKVLEETQPPLAHEKPNFERTPEITAGTADSVALEILAYVNRRTGRKYVDTSQIEERLKDGVTFDECIKVIEQKAVDYKNNLPQYMNPAVIFRKDVWERDGERRE